jgi:cysteine desulfuration protein SufE
MGWLTGMENKTIEAREREFIADFAQLNDRMLQYEYLLCFMDDIHEIPENERTDELRVKGCVSNAWMRVSAAEGGSLYIELASDTLIIKGILGVVTALVGDASCEEISEWEPQFIEKTALKSQLSVDRQKGVSSILQRLKNVC